jgi:hypothetical protein
MTICEVCPKPVGKKSWLLCPEHWQKLPQYNRNQLETSRTAYVESLGLPEANQRKAFNIHTGAIENALLVLKRD